jgi:NAD(P)-dependent dehydrogenase (short-subunit alcohol dehydrogenase family)
VSRRRPLRDTVVLITGATDGLGRGVAERLAREGCTVHLHGRDAARLAATAEAIAASTGNERLVTHRADLAALEEVRALADEVRGSTRRLHVLISNAGIGPGRPDGTARQVSRDGHELRLAVNHLAGFLLQLRLMPLLVASRPARIVNVASIGQRALDFDDPMLERSYRGIWAYEQSKLAQITTGFEMADRLEGTGVTVNSLHPASYMPTKMVMQQRGSSVDPLERGIAATVRLAVAPELERITGRFYDRTREAGVNAQAYDPDARQMLWDLSCVLVGELERVGT